MTAFAAMIAAMFRDMNMTVAASYTPPGGGAGASLRIILRMSDDIGEFGSSRVKVTSRLADVRVADLANPEKGGTLLVGTENYRISAAPMADRERLVWRLELEATA